MAFTCRKSFWKSISYLVTREGFAGKAGVENVDAGDRMRLRRPVRVGYCSLKWYIVDLHLIMDIGSDSNGHGDQAKVNGNDDQVCGLCREQICHFSFSSCEK